MKRALLLTAAGIIAIANAFALIHAWRNRAAVTSDITLTQRELPLTLDTGDEDTEVALNLRWIAPSIPFGGVLPTPWLDIETLKEMGFDTTMDPGDSGATEFYARERARRAFVALEYDETQRYAQGKPQYTQNPALKKMLEAQSRLVAVGAGPDPARLRARYPDRNSVLIVPAVISISLGTVGSTERRLSGYIQEIPSSIHVPRPFSDAFRQLKQPQNAKYRVHLRYGATYEPWIVGVDFDQ